MGPYLTTVPENELSDCQVVESVVQRWIKAWLIGTEIPHPAMCRIFKLFLSIGKDIGSWVWVQISPNQLALDDSVSQFLGIKNTTCYTPDLSLRIVWRSRCILRNSQKSWAFEVFVLRGNHENDQMISRWILAFGGAVFLLNFFFPRFFSVSSPQNLLSFFEFLPSMLSFFPQSSSYTAAAWCQKTRQ